MLAGIRKRLARKNLDSKDCGDDDDKDDLHAFAPPTNYIKISQGKIQLVHQQRSLEGHDGQSISTTISGDPHQLQPNGKDREVLEHRIVELEGALIRIQEKVNKSQCGSPTFEKELREQLENMNRIMKTKERKQMQTFRDHKVLQSRFARQENLMQAMQQENKALVLRIRQYEHCLDDVMRKVVDAIVAEDNLREEVAMLKSRVRDLEAQNAALSASPAKGRDEGYCTMSSGQPQPSNIHLEDLPEEPEQWLLPAEPCSTEMEDWSMSQEELAVITMDDERDHHHYQQQQQQRLRQLAALRNGNAGKVNGEHDWIWNSSDFLNSTMAETDSVSDGISQLLQQKIVYSEDEELACTEFTNDFYKLVNIRSTSARSLYSYIEGDTDDEDEDDDDDDDDEETEDEADDAAVVAPNGEAHHEKVIIEGGDEENGSAPVQLRRQLSVRVGQPPSPTPSEAGRAQVTSCSSSDSDDLSRCPTHQERYHKHLADDGDTDIDEMQTSDLSDHKAQLSDHENDVVPMEYRDGSLVTPLNETKCIEEIIKTELRRPPPPPLVKSKSIVDEDEPSCILRNNQRRELESHVVRSGSVNCAIAAKVAAAAKDAGNVSRIQERLMQRPANSWRRSNGWKRVGGGGGVPSQTAKALISPKKEIRAEIAKSLPTQTQIPKVLPTRIPTCIPVPHHQQQPQQQQAPVASTSPPTQQALQLQPQQQQQSQPPSPQQQQQQPIRKSKIPPPVPVRRSYAS